VVVVVVVMMMMVMMEGESVSFEVVIVFHLGGKQ